jgi:hypothetical protein
VQPAQPANPVQSPKPPTLPHDFIGQVIGDINDIANMFRQAGAPATSKLLADAADHALEVGQLLQRAGL